MNQRIDRRHLESSCGAFMGHLLRATVVGVLGGLLIGLVLDRALSRVANRKNRAVDPDGPTAIRTNVGGWTRRRPKVNGCFSSLCHNLHELHGHICLGSPPRGTSLTL